MLPSTLSKRLFSSSVKNQYKVTVLGASGGIGQPLSLLMKLNHKVSELRLYDLRLAKGVATDLSHIPTDSKVIGFSNQEEDGLAKALDNADVVLIPAGVPRKPGMTRDDLFSINAGIVRDLATAVAKNCPNASICVISNPVNSTVPIVAKVLQKHGVYNPKKLFGVTTLDIIRASRFISEVEGTNPTQERVNVVGGHSGITIIPLISQTTHNLMPKEVRDKLINRIQFGGDEVVKAKDGAGSATLSMSYAGSIFADHVLKGLTGEKDVVVNSFVDSPLYKEEGIDFFSSPVTLGPDGISHIHPIGELSTEEEAMLAECKETLKKNIAKGYKFVEESKL
ncbi:Malate dehydrogenase, cytoplasmic [Hanseniaspora valbyensis]